MKRKWYTAGCLVFLAACASVPTETAVMRQSGVTGMTASEIRFRVHGFAIRYPGVMEQTAFEIANEKPDPAVEHNLLRWLLYGIPAYFKTLFHNDPYLSLVDSWLLTLQLIRYYEDGPGKDNFGEHRDRVLETFAEFDEELRGIIWRARSDSVPPESVARALAWVDENPIESHLLVRRSVLPGAAQLMAQGGGGLGGAVASVQAGIQDLNTRMTIFADFAPKQVQWMAELAAEELLDSLAAEGGLAELLPISGYIGQVDSIVAAHLAFAIDAIAAQRLAVFDAVKEERSTILAAVINERAALLDAIVGEREMALGEIARIVEESLAEVTATSNATVDRAFRGGLLLVLAVFVAAVTYRIVSVKVIGAPRGTPEPSRN